MQPSKDHLRDYMVFVLCPSPQAHPFSSEMDLVNMRSVCTDTAVWYNNVTMKLRNLRSKAVVIYKTSHTALRTKWFSYRNNVKPKRIQFFVHNRIEFEKHRRIDIVGNLPEEIGLMILE